MKNAIELYREINQFGPFLAMDFEEIEAGHIRYKLTVLKEHLATPSVAHGGAIAGFMDGILGVAGLSAVAQEQKLVATLEFKISYFAPAKLGDQLVGTGKILKKGKKILFAEGSIVNQHDELIAKGSGTFTSYPIPNLR